MTNKRCHVLAPLYYVLVWFLVPLLISVCCSLTSNCLTTTKIVNEKKMKLKSMSEYKSGV